MTSTAKPIDAAALAARIRSFAIDPASGVMPEQSCRIIALSETISVLTFVSPSGLAVAWGEALDTVAREDAKRARVGLGMVTTAEHATFRELVAAVCDETFAAEAIAAAGAQ